MSDEHSVDFISPQEKDEQIYKWKEMYIDSARRLRWRPIRILFNKKQFILDIRSLADIVEWHPDFPKETTEYEAITPENSNLSIQLFEYMIKRQKGVTPENLLEHHYTLLKAARSLDNSDKTAGFLKWAGVGGALYGLWKIICPILGVLFGGDFCGGTLGLGGGGGFGSLAYIFGGLVIFAVGRYLSNYQNLNRKLIMR